MTKQARFGAVLLLLAALATCAATGCSVEAKVHEAAVRHRENLRRHRLNLARFVGGSEPWHGYTARQQDEVEALGSDLLEGAEALEGTAAAVASLTAPK